MRRFLILTVVTLATLACSQGQTVSKNDVTADAHSTDQSADITTAETTLPDAQPVDVAQCASHDDCAGQFPDITSCQLALCDVATGSCMVGDMKDGVPCDDADACSLESFCQDGVCLGNGKLDCDDQDPCTLDSCDADTGCHSTALSGPSCDDGNPCTENDTCEDGSCAGDALSCQCETDPDCIAFDDGNLCNGTLTCVDGGCVPAPGSAIQCPDDVGQCNHSICDANTGTCITTPRDDGDDCSDGDACTVGDKCVQGTCQSGDAYVCDECQSAADCVDLDSDNKCLGTHICSQGKCIIDPDTIPTQPKVTCFSSTCDPATGQFVVEALPDGTFCDDLNACTVQDKCSNGNCKGQAATCDDDNICTQDGCAPETGCTFEPLSLVPCDDGNACTAEDTCADGLCANAGELDCDDDNPCTEDSCDIEQGCINAPLSDIACDDGDECTINESCQEGLCVAAGNLCQCDSDADCAQYNDLDLCNGSLHCVDQKCLVNPESVVICDTSNDTDCVQTVCAPLTGECGPKKAGLGSPCDDGNACTLGESCFQGNCLGGILVNCNDGNPCTSDSCDPEFGCLATPQDDTPCEDGDSCTEGDACQAGECQPGLSICGCETDEDCAGFEDGDLCNGTLMCVDGSCTLNEATVVTCQAPEGSCELNLCDPLTGLCALVPALDGTACDDGDACTESDACYEGECLALDVDCDDGNQCTEDSCDSATGCVNNALAGEPCDDGESCTEGDLCEGTVCISGNNVCDCAENGDCVEFDDGNPCNGVFICVENACVLDAASVVTCDPSANTACSKNQCNPSSGDCELTLVPDGTVCNDGLVCTDYDVCLDGECMGEIIDCDDDNPCTDDVCIDQQGGCVYQNNADPCNDGNTCTEGDVCANGKCKGVAILCDDNNVCTKDSCAPATGCLFEFAAGACDDGDACTANDTCNEGTCAGEAVVCDDNNICTDDTCDPAAGCVAYPNKNPCDDANPCTEGDVCAAGECVAGLPANCDDDNDCTDDSCDPQAGGCVNVALSGIACDDGNPCLTGDTCDDGECVGVVAVDCDDGNTCTANSCNPATGCVTTPLSGGECNDGNACTSGDVCAAGVCGGQIVTCNDSNPCTQDLCAPASGCLHPPIQGPGVCSDNNPCTQTDKCQQGVCVGSNPLLCDDDNICTNDSCNLQTGQCDYSANSAPCDDGDPCTNDDQCSAKACLGGSQVVCNDNNQCTDDSCTPMVGCTFTDNGTCQCESDDQCADDNNLCNGSPICVNNVCITDPTTVVTCPTAQDTTCLKNRCQEATGDCIMTPEPDTKTCNDANACTKLDHCNGAGSCVGSDVVCDDDNLCTTDSCNPATGCVYANNTLPCNDNNPCSLQDQCQGGSCQGGGQFICDDGNPCTAGTCYNSNGEPACLYSAITGPSCDDDNACTTNDICQTDGCVGTPLSCDDDNVCTDDSCLPATGCQHTDNTSPCSDDDVCTSGDVCEDGSCQPGAAVFNCCHDVSDCDDDFACTTETCTNNLCQFALLNCDDSNLCTADTCGAGVCGHSPLSSDVILYEEDFDDESAPGWLFGNGTTNDHVGSPDIYWSVNDFRAYSADFSLYAGNPDDQTYDHGNGTAYAYSPPIRLSNATSIELSFRYYTDFEEQGVTWDRLQVLVVAAGSEVPVPLAPWIGDSSSGNFVLATYSLSEFKGQEIRLLFAFITPDSLNNNGEGAYIDDITVIAGQRKGCCFYDGDCNDDDLCSADVCSAGFACDYPYVGGAYFREDFEAGTLVTGSVGDTSKWYITSNNSDVDWHVLDNRSNSTPYAAHAGTSKGHYNAGAFVTTARSPKFGIPVNGNALLKFNVFADLDDPDCVKDVLSVGISTSAYGNVSWLYELCDSTEAFVPVSLDLSNFENQSQLYLHFRFTADGDNNDAEGIFVDDIRVVKAESPPTCCSEPGNCDDNDFCTVNWCSGIPKGGVCASRTITDFSENFDDQKITGWSVTPLGGTNPYVSWYIDDYRSYSQNYSLYAGYPKYQTYYGYGLGTTTAATPYFYLDYVKGENPLLEYHRYLDLCTLTTKHCFVAAVQQKNGTLEKVEEVCSSLTGIGNQKWVGQQFDLTEFMGKEIRLVFSFSIETATSCGQQAREGVYLDDVNVYFKGCK